MPTRSPAGFGRKIRGRACGMFAYTFYNRPPVNIEKLEPNLYLSFVYQSAAHRDPQNLKEWRKSVAGWQKLGARMVVREGWGNHYYHDMHFLHYNQIIANLDGSTQTRVRGRLWRGQQKFRGHGTQLLGNRQNDVGPCPRYRRD